MEHIEEILPTEAFYKDIILYHDKVDKILKLIRDYFDNKKAKCEKEFAAIEIIEGSVKEATLDLTSDDKEKIEFWFRNDHEKSELNNSIYSLEFADKIFFCKVFPFQEKNSVLAGYLLNDRAIVRTFISKLSEQKLKEKYEKILSIM